METKGQGAQYACLEAHIFPHVLPGGSHQTTFGMLDLLSPLSNPYSTAQVKEQIALNALGEK